MGFLGVPPIASKHPVQFSSSFIGSFLLRISSLIVGRDPSGSANRIYMVFGSSVSSVKSGKLVSPIVFLQIVGISGAVRQPNLSPYGFFMNRGLSTLCQPAFTIRPHGTGIRIAEI